MAQTTTVRRFCRDEMVGMSLRLPVTLVDRLDAMARWLTKEGPASSRSEALRMCLVAGLDAFASGAARSSSSCDPEMQRVADAVAKLDKKIKKCKDCVDKKPLRGRKTPAKPHSKEKCAACGGALPWTSEDDQAALARTFPELAKARLASDAATQSANAIDERLLYAACPPGDPACALGIMGGICSIPAALYVPQADGPPIKQVSRYCVVDANKLTPSHQPLKGFIESPGYPAGVQERRYDKDKLEQAKVLQYAERMVPAFIFNTNPDAINGPPVVTETGLVLGGNGRAMAMQLHYAEGPDETKAARTYLLEHTAEFGLNPDDVKKINRPALVRVVKIPDDKATTLSMLVRRYNQGLTQGMDARTEAVAEARQVSARALEILSENIAPDDTLASFLASPASRTFVNELRADGVINQRNAAQYLSGAGTLNDLGKGFVERVLVAVVLPDATLLDDLGAQLRASIARTVPYVLASQVADHSWHLQRALSAAARDVVRMRTQGMTSVDEYLRGLGLFADIKPAVESVELGPELLRALFELGGSPVKLARVFQGYSQAAGHSPRGQGGLSFGAEAPMETPRQVLARLLP